MSSDRAEIEDEDVPYLLRFTANCDERRWGPNPSSRLMRQAADLIEELTLTNNAVDDLQ